MKRKIDFSYSKPTGHIEDIALYHMIPNNRTKAVGPFVGVDYMSGIHFKAREPQMPDGHGAHPHRGNATFTYLLHGELEHFDSKGHYGIVNDGGGQWMNAGNGIIYDENLSQAFQKSGGTFLGFQFWMNLPSHEKNKAPDYIAIHDCEIPKLQMPNNAGNFKVVIGTMKGKASKIKTYTEQFLYHLQINPDKIFEMDITNTDWEYAAFAVNGNTTINDTPLANGTLMVFGEEGSSICFENNTDTIVDIVLFGGEPYTWPVVDLWYGGTTFDQVSKGDLAGFQLTGSINHSDFGIGAKFPSVMISDKVSIKANEEF